MSNETILIGDILGAILQPIYLCLFITSVKGIKNKRFVFILLSILDYILIQYYVKFNLSINADLIYAIIFFVNVCFMYKGKGRITDFITYIISFLIMGIASIIFISVLGTKIITIILCDCFLIALTLIFSKKIHNIENFYNKFWNKHSLKGIKSVTLRGFSAIITIITFILLHLWLIHGAL